MSPLALVEKDTRIYYVDSRVAVVDGKDGKTYAIYRKDYTPNEKDLGELEHILKRMNMSKIGSLFKEVATGLYKLEAKEVA